MTKSSFSECQFRPELLWARHASEWELFLSAANPPLPFSGLEDDFDREGGDSAKTQVTVALKAGAWAWINMDSVTIPGAHFDAMGGVPDGENLVPLPKIAFRLGQSDELLRHYRDHPESYPVSRARIDYLHFDGNPGDSKIGLFDSRQDFIERRAYDPEKPGFQPHEIRNRIRSNEDAGWDVVCVFVYREEWIYNPNAHGPFPQFDKRILSQQDIDNIRSGIRNADPPLKRREDYKIIQLLGGRVSGERGDSWLRMDQRMKEYLEQFDGIRTELHIDGQFNNETYPYQSYTPVDIAQMATWAEEKNKLALVFMGEATHTYERASNTQETYEYLWNEMDKVGVNPRAGHLLYFRQGASDGKYTPESDPNTLTHQMKWLIEHLKNVPHINVVRLSEGRITFNFPKVQYNRNHIEFSIDGGQSYPLRAAVNSGTAAFRDLTPGTYDIWVRWGNGACPVRLGTYTLQNADPLPQATVSVTHENCGGENGKVTLTFPDNLCRTAIRFSIDGGENYTSVQDNSGSYTFSHLAPGDYEVWTRWGNRDCPVKLGNYTVGGIGEVSVKRELQQRDKRQGLDFLVGPVPVGGDDDARLYMSIITSQRLEL